MNIGVQLDREDYLYDIHSLVKSFFPDDDVSIYTEDDADRCKAARDFLLCVHIPEEGDRKTVKDSLKKEIYGLLSDYTGKSLPWGTLSGIRPTKIPMKMLEEGLGDLEIKERMQEAYLISDEKAELAIRVAKKERELLSGVSLGPETFSLYLHVPFCPSICLYCTFSASCASQWEGRMDEYLDAVEYELSCGRPMGRLDAEKEGRPHSGQMSDVPDTGRKPVTFYVGGGTPTSLSARQLDRLLDMAEEYYDFSACIERTVEAGRPDSVTRKKLEILKKHHVTRISINPQTMNQRTLDLIGRGHTAEDTQRAFYMAREAGFDNINMDIILGLPGEEPEDVARTLDLIEKMSPDSLTVHSLAVKRASRLTRKLREEFEAGRIGDYSRYEGLAFVNSEAIIGMAYESAARMGMNPYYLYRQKNMKGGLENTGFARPGKECLYNILIMEEMQGIKAFGAGASTKMVYPDGRIERIINPKDVRTYLERVESAK
ncbi:MAG: coproporphyrinogen dehydrogenase HemZ [Lachnospiraceae bacterium]|nr:coproporphyrinogen dehydrogenase HemZ [Lachnospiraceae bacterium]